MYPFALAQSKEDYGERIQVLSTSSLEGSLNHKLGICTKPLEVHAYMMDFDVAERSVRAVITSNMPISLMLSPGMLSEYAPLGDLWFASSFVDSDRYFRFVSAPREEVKEKHYTSFTLGLIAGVAWEDFPMIVSFTINSGSECEDFRYGLDCHLQPRQIAPIFQLPADEARVQFNVLLLGFSKAGKTSFMKAAYNLFTFSAFDKYNKQASYDLLPFTGAVHAGPEHGTGDYRSHSIYALLHADLQCVPFVFYDPWGFGNLRKLEFDPWDVLPVKYFLRCVLCCLVHASHS